MVFVSLASYGIKYELFVCTLTFLVDETSVRVLVIVCGVEFDVGMTACRCMMRGPDLHHHSVTQHMHIHMQQMQSSKCYRVV